MYTNRRCVNGTVCVLDVSVCACVCESRISSLCNGGAACCSVCVYNIWTLSDSLFFLSSLFFFVSFLLFRVWKPHQNRHTQLSALSVLHIKRFSCLTFSEPSSGYSSVNTAPDTILSFWQESAAIAVVWRKWRRKEMVVTQFVEYSRTVQNTGKCIGKKEPSNAVELLTNQKEQVVWSTIY